LYRQAKIKIGHLTDLRQRQFRVVEHIPKADMAHISNLIKASVDVPDGYE